MAPLMDQLDVLKGDESQHHQPSSRSSPVPRVLVIGAGSRGNAYAQATLDSGLGIVAAIAEPIKFKRNLFASKYIRSKSNHPTSSQVFDDWRAFIAYEISRRNAAASNGIVEPGIDAVFVCVRDEQHREVVESLAPLGLHVMCEKPLATTLNDCLAIQRALSSYPRRIFAIGHVLRYSPHNMMLRHLVLQERAIGDILSIEHVEPVGYWHFAHSYVRGNWRKESATAPSLLTKSCHDIDWLLWMMCSPPPGQEGAAPHLPDTVSSAGTLKQFRRERKPKAAGPATNCLSCPVKDTCFYSAKRIYYDRHLAKGLAAWPVHIVNPEVESLLVTDGPEVAKKALFDTLSEDYEAATTPVKDIEDRTWYGRCVYESDNDVCDDQFVTLTWSDATASPSPSTDSNIPHSKYAAKSAAFHMIAQTQAQCARRGRIYGTSGEISYDSSKITIYDFQTGEERTLNPEVPKNSHHGGGDVGLTGQFLGAVGEVMRREASGSGSVADEVVDEVQRTWLGCDLEECVRSHVVVFAAEEARRKEKVVRLAAEGWWDRVVHGGTTAR